MNGMVAASGDKLAADTAMGAVTLLVGDLDALTAFYRDVVTLQVLAAEGDTVTLGRAGRAIVILQREPALRHATPGSAGLYHTAILFETQAALAAALYSVARQAPGTFTGSADHLVSQAFYFTDPASACAITVCRCATTGARCRSTTRGPTCCGRRSPRPPDRRPRQTDSRTTSSVSRIVT